MKIGRPVIGVLVAAIAGTAGSQNRGVRYGPGVCGPIDPVYVKDVYGDGWAAVSFEYR